MKAKLEFDLDRVEDEEKFRVCSKGVDWYLVCFMLDKDIRDMVKYQNAPGIVTEIRSILHRYMDQYGVSLEDMS